MIQQTGLLTGIKNIEPPTRLSFYPYSSAEVDRFDGQTETNFNAGLDVKYGISKAFTLNITLVFDFDQVTYDDVELNLGGLNLTFRNFWSVTHFEDGRFSKLNKDGS